jgi:DNA repair exonuclease SbcCD ATPase subunit
LAQSLTKSSASLVAAGGDLAEAAALTATANAIIQDADSVGTALKTTSLRLRGTDVKVLEEEGLDSEGAVTSKSKLQGKVKALSGVDILTATGEYKSTYEILVQIAEVWESMNDMDQAALLELIAGKRNSSVVAAILQNPEELKKAFEDANDASGSALRENEKYLDSIQGKIDQFNNATQTMWSNFLDDDVVKFVVELGTELIRIIDKVGLLNSLVLVFAGSKLIPWILQAVTGMGTFGESLKYVGMMMTSVNGTGAALIPTIVAQTQALWAGSAGANVFTLSLKTLGIAFKALMATPLGWFLAIAAAIALTVHLFDVFTTTTAELKEELEDLQAELQDIKSDLEAVNSELETTNDRMAELLAKDTLSFVEEEELKALRERNEELQREIDLLKLKEKQTKQDTANKFVETMGSDLGPRDFWAEYKKDGEKIRKVKWWDYIIDLQETATPNWTRASEGEYIQQQIERYRELQTEIDAKEDEILESDGTDKKSKKKREKLEKQKKKLEDEAREIEGYINGKTTEFDKLSEGLDYGISDETDVWLDYINNMRDKWAITSGGDNAKTNALNRIFNKDENAAISRSIDGYIGALKNGDTSAKSSIENIIKNNKDLVEDIEATGLSVEDAVDYFTSFSSGIGNTVEEITSRYQKGIDALGKYKGAATDIIAEFTDEDGVVEKITWGSLFDDNGNAIDTQISKVLQGADETARKEFARIAEAVNEGKMSVDNAMKSFSTSGVQAGYKLLENAVVEINSDIFKDLGDEISGLIDTFEEFGSALESVAKSIELVAQAEAEMAYSGHLSVETALELINSTEDWNKVLKVENGNITLVDGAMDILAQSKLNQIKTNLQLALSEAQAGLEQARLAESSGEVAKTLEESTTESVRQLAANMEYLSTLIGEFLAGNFLGAGSAAASAKQKSLDATTYQKTSTTSSMSVADWEEKVSNIEAKLGILESVDTTGEFENNYYSNKVSGGNGTKEEVTKSKWDELIDKYERELALIINERDLVQAEIDKAEANGGQASKEMYDDLIRLQLEEKKLLEDKKAELEAYLAEYGDSIDPETWTEYNDEINATAVAIKECTTNIYDFAQSLRDIDMHYFEQATEEISRLAEEIDFVMGLFEDEEMSDEAGNWTEAGITKINLLRDQMTAYAGLAKMWGDRLTELQGMTKGENGLYAFDEKTKNDIAADFESMFNSGKIDKATYDAYMQQLNDAWTAGGFSEEIYNEWVNEAEDGMRDAISGQKDTRDKLLDMWDEYIDKIEEGVQKEIEAYEDLINAQKEELDAARELHDFRKQVANDSKDIQELERRIASLSGSTAASDVAERRKLQAQLRDKQGELDDRYYDHAHDARSNALDDEANAFAEAKNRYVENMREAAKDTEWVVNEMLTNGIFNADVANAFLTRIHDTYNVPLSPELTGPWAAAATEAEKFKNQVGIIAGEGIPPSVTMISDDIRNKLATNDANNPWNQAITMADKYADFLTDNEFSLDNKDMTTFEGQINSIISKWKAVKTAADNAYAAQNRTYNVGGDPNVGAEPDDDGEGTQKKYYTTATLNLGSGHVLTTTQSADTKTAAESAAKTDILRQYADFHERRGVSQEQYESFWKKQWQKKVEYNTQYYAKGTTGTPRDEWTITDELGPELTMYATPEGTLSFMRAGSTVVPAEITKNLVEWGQFTPDALNLGGGVNVNMINNAVNKPEFNFAFDALVKAENITEETLPAVKKFITQELNRFTKELNYALKGKGAR